MFIGRTSKETRVLHSHSRSTIRNASLVRVHACECTLDLYEARICVHANTADILERQINPDANFFFLNSRTARFALSSCSSCIISFAVARTITSNFNENFNYLDSTPTETNPPTHLFVHVLKIRKVRRHGIQANNDSSLPPRSPRLTKLIHTLPALSLQPGCTSHLI